MSYDMILANDADAQSLLRNGSRPIVNKKTGQVQVMTSRGLTVNSALRKDEWEELDRAVVSAAVAPLTITNRLLQAGLTNPLGSLATVLAQYNQVSEMTAASANLSGVASVQKDLADFDLVSVPVPIIFKEFEIAERHLLASRRLGDGIDVTNGSAAARVVGEKVEDLLINGDTNINVNGNTIYGLTSHPDRNTDTATNYGGGDWGTIANVVSTINGMITAARAAKYYGPYGIFVYDTQYMQAAGEFYTDGSGQTPLQRILQMPMVSFVESSQHLADGEVVLVTLSREVVELRNVQQYWPVSNLEWMSGDGMLNNFKVMSVFTPVVKSDYSGNSGIVHATGA